jgi:hypothetical protein
MGWAVVRAALRESEKFTDFDIAPGRYCPCAKLGRAQISGSNGRSETIRERVGRDGHDERAQT